MSPFWKRLLLKFLRVPEINPFDPSRNTTNLIGVAGAEKRSMQGYPRTYQAVAKNAFKEEYEEEYLEYFEPALKQFARAYRLGDPLFQDAATRTQWYHTRRQVMDHLLHLISASKWRDNLVLRGSLLLKVWLEDAGREPGDVDWVFRPATIEINDPFARELFEDLTQMISDQPQIGKARIDTDNILVDDIWTYERASGRRIVFPWKAEGLPPGYVQMDVVFSEKLFTEPEQVRLPSQVIKDEIVLWAATKTESLAWKLLWLETDMYPQGKDLYDATLLAEQTTLSLELLRQVLETGDEYHSPADGLQPNFPLQWDVDWHTFKQEYPWIEGEAQDWQARLTSALSSTFQGTLES